MVLEVTVKGLEHTDGDGVLDVGTSSDEGRGLTKQIRKNGEKKISARLQPQGKASKQVIKASTENRKKAGKQDGCHKETKILYMVWIILIKYYLSYTVSKHGIRIKTDKKKLDIKIPKLRADTEELQPGGQTNLEVGYKNSETAGRYNRTATWRAGLYMVCLHEETLNTGMWQYSI